MSIVNRDSETMGLGRTSVAMNYFAHGMQYIDRPYFLAGTAVPDWLSAVDRKVRMRTRYVAPFADGSGTIQAEIAAGVLQHLEDDQWFHRTRAFIETSAELALLFRSALGNEDAFRPGLLGHIVTELILDGILIQQNLRLLDDYYASLQKINADAVQNAVNRMTQHATTSRLATLIGSFQQEQFLRDYLDPTQLVYRLNQVMRRIKLKQVPNEIEDVIKTAWSVVTNQIGHLLPNIPFTTHTFNKTRNSST